MLKTIIMNEMQRYFLSRIFQVALSVLIFLVLVTTIIGADDYARRRQDYLDAVREMGWNPESREMNVFRPPQPLSALAAGKDRIFGVRKYLNTFKLEGGAASYMERELSTAGQMLNNIPLIDVAFVIRFYFSLLVIFIGFTAIAGEKETGTLRQVVANSIPRNTLILGKFTAGMIILAFSLAASGVVAFAVMMWHPQVPFGNAEAVRTMLFFGTAFLYGSVFFAGSMAVSVVANRSSTALLFLFMFWIVLVVLVPNLGKVVVEHFSPVTVRYTMSGRWQSRRK